MQSYLDISRIFILISVPSFALTRNDIPYNCSGLCVAITACWKQTRPAVSHHFIGVYSLSREFRPWLLFFTARAISRCLLFQFAFIACVLCLSKFNGWFHCFTRKACLSLFFFVSTLLAKSSCKVVFIRIKFWSHKTFVTFWVLAIVTYPVRLLIGLVPFSTMLYVQVLVYL